MVRFEPRFGFVARDDARGHGPRKGKWTLRSSRRGWGVNPLPTLVTWHVTRIYETVASSPRAVTDRLLGCVGTVRIDTNYAKPPGPTPRRSARNLTLGVAPESMV